MLIISVAVITLRIVTTITAPTFRVVSSGREPNLDLPTDINFHCFLSHAWGTGQDQTHTLARQMQLLLPGAKIWLDVDNLDDVGKLEQSVKESATFIIFLSKGYFKSANCRRELYTALAEGKPIIVVREADEAKGGADVEDFKAECVKECVETGPPAYPSYQGPTEVLERLFTEEPVVWVRVHDFQKETLKVIALRMLMNLPYYQCSIEALSMGLRVPGEVGPVGLRTPMKLLVCSDNEGARPVAEEIMDASMEDGHATQISIHDAEEVLGEVSVLRENGVLLTDNLNAAMLLYLNTSTFQDEHAKVSQLVQSAMDSKVPLVLVHEQDTSKGGCPFRCFFDSTPKTLLKPPYKLFDTVATPLFPTTEHRLISLRHILVSMGATAISAGQSDWRACFKWLLAEGGERPVLLPAHGALETQAPVESVEEGEQRGPAGSQTSPAVQDSDVAAGPLLTQPKTQIMKITDFLSMQRETRIKDKAAAGSRTQPQLLEATGQMSMCRQVNLRGFVEQRNDDNQKLDQLEAADEPAPILEDELGNMLEDGGAAAAGPARPPSSHHGSGVPPPSPAVHSALRSSSQRTRKGLDRKSRD